MGQATSKLRAWAELTRISNLPTCVSNVLVGCALGADNHQINWWAALAAGGIVAAFYVGGMALNDVFDTRIDASERPSRPIPSGRISKRHATMLVIVSMAAGLAASAAMGMDTLLFAGILVAAIVTYNWLHKRLAASIVLMGACRGLVYVLAASVAGALAYSMPLVALTAAMTLYVTLLTWIARSETGAPQPTSRYAGLAMMVVALLPAVIVRPVDVSHAIAGGLLMTMWLVRTASRLFKPQARLVPVILGFLSGICLVDAFFLTLLDQPVAAVVAIACFAATAAGHRRILGT